MLIAVWGFWRYRGRLGQAAQHAAIWGLIFIGVVLAIGFFEPLQNQLMSDRAQMVDERTVKLERGRDGHFYALLQVDGTDVRFMVDTGATMMVLNQADAEAVGLEPDTLDYFLRSQTANGEVSGAPVRLDSVRLGPFLDTDVRAVVNGGELRQSLLGMSYLDRYEGFRVEGEAMYLSRAPR
ncbi:MAG: TIGR02281 family clan AA aspartic protease [Pseudomonadota bacterium]